MAEAACVEGEGKYKYLRFASQKRAVGSVFYLSIFFLLFVEFVIELLWLE